MSAHGVASGVRATWGGPPRLICDNASAVGRQVAGAVRLTDRCQRVPAHDGFPVTLCNPYSGDEQGHVENQVGSRRRHLLVPRPDVDDLPAFNQALLARCEADWNRPHYKQHTPLATLVRDDQAALGPLPRARFDPVRYVTVKTDGDGKFGWDGAPYYATAPDYARQTVTIQVGAYTLTVLSPDDGAVVATHRRRFGSRRTDRGDPRTQLTRLARNPGAWGHSAVREQAPADLRPRLDTYARDELRAVLPAWAARQGQYGADVALQALREAVQRGRSVVAEATVLAARLATWGPDRPADPGPDWAA
jgi:hypothetical protein